jgi:hypothetical protein
VQVGESIKKFGVSDGTQHLLLARFDATPEDVSNRKGKATVTLPATTICLPPPKLNVLIRIYGQCVYVGL